MRFLLFLIVLISIPTALTAQSQIWPEDRPDWWPAELRDEMVETNSINMQVYRMGDQGPPVVLLQDMHDYLDPRRKWADDRDQEEWLANARRYAAFASSLAEDYRVYIPIRRGYGRTTDPGTGYDVATHAADVLAMLKAEGIGEAIFVGRHPSQNEMYWIAEHHPERMTAMVLLAPTPVLPADFSDPDVREFLAGWWSSPSEISDDPERVDEIILPRMASRQPHFVSDPEARIDVPTLYLEEAPPFSGAWMWASLFSAIDGQAKCPAVTGSFPCNVLGSPERRERLRTYFREHPNVELAASNLDRMKAAFTKLNVVEYNPVAIASENMWDDFHSKILPFMASVSE